MPKTKVVTLVPWRGGDDRREWCYDVTRPSLERLGFPIFEGDGDGPWARAAAVNNAAARAGAWDVAFVSDTDTVADPASIRRAIAWVLDTRGGARPHDERWMLTKEGSVVFAQRGPAALAQEHIGRLFAGGGLLVVHREAWEAIGGFDEGFVGWGYEDSAMNVALLTKARWDRLPGDAWHLWHPGSDNKPRMDSVKRHKKLLADNLEQIERWAHNKGLRAPMEVL